MKDKKDKKKSRKGLIAVVAGALLIGVPAISAIKNASNQPERITYKEYQEYLQEGKIDIVSYEDGSEYMKIYLGDSNTADMTDEEKEKYDYPDSSVYRVQFPDNEDFRKEMLEQGVVLLNTANDNKVIAFIDQYSGLIIYLALIGVLIVAMKKANPASATGFMQEIDVEDIKVTFDDVIGHEEIKDDLKLLVKQMQDGKNARDLSHGILFEGGAGTGKTMLAKAVAHEAGLNFISVDSSNLVEMYVGLGARRVREAFKKARKVSPCVLFFDELDAVGAKRGSQRSHRENDQTINALLTEMDGFQSTDNVFVIAATNRSDSLDDALVRSGRFDRKVKIEAPKKWETRKELFDHYLKDHKIADDVDTEILAKQVVGFSGADIAAVIREATLISYRNEVEGISQDNIEEAIDKILCHGNVSREKQNILDTKIVAYHEAGHAIAKLYSGENPSRISIRSMTSDTGGITFGTDDDRMFMSKKCIRNLIIGYYAGRASEEAFFGKDEITEGARGDITAVSHILYKYVAKYGFDESFGLIDYDILVQKGMINDECIRKRMSELSVELYNNAVELISKHKEETEILAKKLIEVKTLDGNEVLALLGKDKKDYESC